MKRTKIYMVLLLQFLLFLLSCSKEKLSIPATNGSVTSLPSNDAGNIFKNQIWKKDWPPGTGLWCFQWVGGDIFYNHPYLSSPRYERDYYADHVRVYIKPSDADLWQAIPYVPRDHYGANNYDIYFTDDNYIASLGGLGTIIAPRILILAKPGAPIDFSKPFDVKIVFV